MCLGLEVLSQTLLDAALTQDWFGSLCKLQVLRKNTPGELHLLFRKWVWPKQLLKQTNKQTNNQSSKPPSSSLASRKRSNIRAKSIPWNCPAPYKSVGNTLWRWGTMAKAPCPVDTCRGFPNTYMLHADGGARTWSIQKAFSHYGAGLLTFGSCSWC